MANQILAGAVFQAGQVIAGVDADNPPYVGPPVAKWITRSITGSPRTLYIRSVMDIDSDPTTLVNTASGFGGNEDMAVHPSGQYIAVGDIYEGGDGVVFVYDTQDLSAPLATLSPDGGEATYNQNYQFGRSLAMSDTKLFIGNNAQGVPVYCYDLSDLSAAPSKISTPTSYHNGDYMFSSDMAANSTHLFIGHQSCRNPLTSNDNMTEAGAVHVYDVETLQYQTTLYGFNPEHSDYFGSEVKATDTHLAVGAYGDDEVHGSQNQNGAVYVFDAADLSATPTKVMPLTSGHSDEYARFISLSDTHLAVSEYQDNTHNNNSGALHIYDLNNLSNPMIHYGSLYSEYYGLRPLLFNDGSNRISFYRSFANLGQPAKYFVYNINDMTTPLWESETEMPYAFLPAYVAPPPPPPATVADMTIDDWTVIGGNELIANPGGSINTEFWWRRNEIVNYGHDSVAYYEIINMVPGESYELTFDVKLASGSPAVGVEVHRTDDASFLMASTYTNGGYQSQTLSWTQPSGLTKAYMHLVSQNSGGVGEMRDAVLTKVS